MLFILSMNSVDDDDGHSSRNGGVATVEILL